MSSSLVLPLRAVGWGGMTVVFVTYMAGTVVLLAFARKVPHFAIVISQSSAGILSQTLVFYAILLTVSAIVLFRVQHLLPQDVGLMRARIRGGVLAYCVIWASYQVVLVVVSQISQGHLSLYRMWSTPAQYPAILSGFITFVFGVALSEEIVFRGYLLPQALLALHTIRQPWLRLSLALVVSQGAFALYHIPVTLLQGASVSHLVGRLIILFITGTLLALLYLQTHNLFLVVAIHGLADWPMPLFSQTVLSDLNNLAFVAASLLLVLWPFFTHHSGLGEMAHLFRTSAPQPTPISRA